MYKFRILTLVEYIVTTETERVKKCEILNYSDFSLIFFDSKGTLKISRHHCNEVMEEWLIILMFN